VPVRENLVTKVKNIKLKRNLYKEIKVKRYEKRIKGRGKSIKRRGRG